MRVFINSEKKEVSKKVWLSLSKHIIGNQGQVIDITFVTQEKGEKQLARQFACT